MGLDHALMWLRDKSDWTGSGVRAVILRCRDWRKWIVNSSAINCRMGWCGAMSEIGWFIGILVRASGRAPCTWFLGLWCYRKDLSRVGTREDYRVLNESGFKSCLASSL